MARKTLSEQIHKLNADVTKAKSEVDKAQAKYDTLSNELDLCILFSTLKDGDYILTDEGKGTVLNVVKDDPYRSVRVFFGTGPSANIKVIKYWQLIKKL